MFSVILGLEIAAALLFCAAVASLAVFLYNAAKKNEAAKKRSLRVLIPSAIAWFVLSAAAVALLVGYVYKNRESLLDKAVSVPAEAAGKGFALTFQSFEKNWDKNRLKQLESLRISFSSMEYEVVDDTKLYDIELIFDNTSPADTKLYLDDLIGNHYLLVCDRDDFVYTLPLTYTKTRTTRTSENSNEGESSRTETASTQYNNTIIPPGKSRFRFNVTVPDDVELTHARFVDAVIPLK